MRPANSQYQRLVTIRSLPQLAQYFSLASAFSLELAPGTVHLSEPMGRMLGQLLLRLLVK
jgi:hypothetical protein